MIKLLCFVAAAGFVTVALALPNFHGEARAAGVISINFFGDNRGSTVPAGELAGVVPRANWNEVSGGGGSNGGTQPPQTLDPLVDDDNASTTAKLELDNNLTFTATPNFSVNPTGNNAMMGGHSYDSAFQPVPLIFTDIPYPEYDLYIYFNSGAVDQTQTFDVNATGQSVTVYEAPGDDTGFVLSDGMGNNDSNYVIIPDVNTANITLTAQGASGQFGYFNGIQIVAPEAFAVVGDLTGDGFVGGSDLQLVLGQWGDMEPLMDDRGDCSTSMDGFIGGADLQCVLGTWGQGGQSGVGSVPEPSALLLAVVASLVLVGFGRWRQAA